MPDIDILVRATNRASGPLKDVGDDVDRLDKKAGNVAAKGIGQLQHALGVGLKVAAGVAVVALGAVGVALVSSFKAAANFEQSIADIRAIMGKTGPSIEELGKVIHGLALDPLLKVNATEAADAINMLAKNGITWEEISGGMARSTILLANATNDDFALAADLATDVMVQFNKDASDMEEVINSIVGVTQASKFDINDWSLAVAQAGGVAGQTGLPLEDFNALLGLTSSYFSSGSDAGTSFKVFLQQLIPDTNKSADAMRELGLFSGLTGAEFDKLQGKISDTQQKIAALDPTSKNYGEQLSKLTLLLSEQRSELNKGSSAFFDAEGNYKSAEEIVAALSTAFSGLSDAERNSAASTIFGTDAMRTALALAGLTQEAVSAYKAEVANTSAEDAATIRMDTLNGAWEIFLGVVESLSIQLGTTFLPIARDVVEWATQLATTHGPAVIAWFSGLTSSITTFVSLLQSGQPPLTAFRDAFVGFIPPATMAAFDQIVEKTKAVIDWVGKAIGPFISWKDVMTGLAIVLGTVVVTAIGGFLAAIAPVAIVIGGAIAAVALMRNAWERDWGGIQEKTKTAMDYISGRFGPLGTTIKTFGADALQEIAAWANGTETEFTATNKIVDEAKKTFGLLWDDFAKRFPETATVVNDAWIKVSDATKIAWTYVVDKSAGLVTAIRTFGVDSLKEIVAWATGTETKFTATQAIWIEFRDTVVEVADDIRAAFFSPNGAGTKMGLWLRTEFPAASAASVFASNELKAAFTNLATATGTSFGLTKNQATSFMLALQDVIGKGLAVVITRMTTFVANFGDLMKLMDRANQRDWKGMWDAIQSVQDRATRTQLFDAAVWAGEMELAMQIAGADTVKGYASGIDANGNLGKAAMSTFDARVKQQMFDDFGIRSPSTVFQGYGVDTIQGFINGIGGMIGAVGSKMGEVANAVKGFFGDTSQWLLSAGQNAVQGFINGIGNMIGAAQAKVAELANLAAQALGITLESQSPSRRFRRYGEWAGQGFVDGMNAKLGAAQQMAAQLAQVAAQSVAAAVMPSGASGEITDVLQGVFRAVDHLKSTGEILGASSKSFNIAANIESTVDAVMQGVSKVLAHEDKWGEILGASSKSFGIASELQGMVDAAIQKMTGMAAPSTTASMASAAQGGGMTYAQQSTAAPLITDTYAGVAKVFDHMIKYGELLGASSKKLNILDSIEGSVDAAVQGVMKIMYHYRDFGQEILSAHSKSLAIDDSLEGIVDATIANMKNSLFAAFGIHSPSKFFDYIGEMSAKGFTQGFERGMSNTPTSINNSRTTSNSMVVQVQSTGDGVRDIRNQVELYALTFGAT